MKQIAYILLLSLFAASLTLAQTPVPRGIREADQTEVQTQKNIPPPITQPLRIDLVKLRQNADDLARMTQTIPLDVASIQKGLLPKDIIAKLKEIERLSKQLRKQLNP